MKWPEHGLGWTGLGWLWPGLDVGRPAHGLCWAWVGLARAILNVDTIGSGLEWTLQISKFL
jgi:hypothetical protein